MGDELRLGVIGCGKQARKHIASLKKIPNVQLVLTDLDRDCARKVAGEEQLDCVDDSVEIFMDPSIRAVVICTPTRSHMNLIRSALEAGKDVFCEKPLSDSLSEVIELQSRLSTFGRIVMIGYIYRFVPVFTEGFKLFRKQKLNGESLTMGRTLSAFLRLGGRGSHQLWKHQKVNGGGAINEMLVHMLDLANWYFGPLMDVEVTSCGLFCPVRHIQGEKVRVDAEDFVIVRCAGADGAEIHCQADLITPAFSQYIEVQAENGSFMGSIQEDMPSYVYLKESRGGYAAGKTHLDFGPRNILDIQMMEFVQAILKREPPGRNSVADSLELMKVLEQIRRHIG
ncbi:Gfo/Idh/MocA family protein [Desulfoferrobacter suflitae]|uniref:Gfo/Idh/MocA family protein n=1 Tax=Desulfoferrobacter suflitae TaxID=2865782 RepID=UPI002164D252|nr:Gfo/Idh/MocA family oxidoreductase [Desulfoferrobacter suflitae]MCK8604352.1 Gfo/Idh/MocA family oxidoreductase [Desulfoferrobacter suflitae]